MKHLTKGVVAGAAFVALGAGASSAQDEVEVLHWWTAGGEAAALEVLKENLEAEGITWSDMPVAGGAGDAAMTSLRARVTSGNAPTAVQMLGYDITEWAEAGAVANLDEVAEEENWADVIPAALQEFSKHEDQWIAAPVNIHSTNWLWINKEALNATGMEPPTDWDGFIALLDAFEEQGLVPLAHGGQAWQDATVWENVVLSMGTDFYKSAVLERNQDALTSEEMQTVFERMDTLRGYVDENFSGRDWNLASAMVIEGEAGMQQMGDWAKGEFLRADMTPDEDFVCIRFPGTQGAVTFNTDQFVMFEVGEERRDAQLEMASAIMDPSFQIAFNTVKGSVPARTDVSDEEFDACGKKSMADIAEAAEAETLVGSLAHGHAAPPAVKNAMQDVITQHFNGAISTEDAPEALAEAVEFAM